jgi:hypothetical protein
VDRQEAVALRISYKKTDFYQYLIFTRASTASADASGWKLIGHFESPFQQSAPPAHRIEHGDGRTWLVVKVLWRQGAGWTDYGETWYEIQPDSVKRVLAYPAQGDYQACQAGLGSAYKSFSLRHDMENGVYTIPIQFFMAYNLSDCADKDSKPALFSRGFKAVYVWDAAKGEFALDRSRSEVTAKQLDRLCCAAPSAEAFVEDNFTELVQMAAGGDARRKAWLKGFLPSVKDTPRKAELQRLLQQ